jgi:hypothetical protein
MIDRVFGQSLVRCSSIGKNWIPRGTDMIPYASLVFHPLHGCDLESIFQIKPNISARYELENLPGPTSVQYKGRI